MTLGPGSEQCSGRDDRRSILVGVEAGRVQAEQFPGLAHVIGQATQETEGKRVWVWSVTGPASPGAPSGILAQKYIADPRGSVGPVMVLVGESNDAISLQAETAGGAARIMEVELKLLTTPA